MKTINNIVRAIDHKEKTARLENCTHIRKIYRTNICSFFFILRHVRLFVRGRFHYRPCNAFIQIELPWATCPFNVTLNDTEPECKSPTTYFWYHTTLEASASMDDSGGLKWWIVLCLFAAWTAVFLIMMKGIQSSGNVSNKILDTYKQTNKQFLWNLNFCA